MRSVTIAYPPDSRLNEPINKHNLAHTVWASNYITSFNHFAIIIIICILYVI